MDELQQLIALAGANTFAEAVANMSAVNAQLTGAQSALGTRDAASTFAALSSRSTQFAAIERATGCEGDEAVGSVRAALTAKVELEKAQARVKELEKGAEVHALDSAVAKAKAEKRWTPALETEVRAAFAAGDITLKGAEKWLATAPQLPGAAAPKEPAQGRLKRPLSVRRAKRLTKPCATLADFQPLKQSGDS
jgi:hypothetical protein